MDGKPFMEIDLLNFNERTLPELQKLTKETWDLDSALSSAETLKFVRAVKLMIAEEAAEPSDALVRMFASRCYEGKLMTRIIDMFRPVVKRAFAEHVLDQISKRLNSVRVAEEETLSAAQATEVKMDTNEEEGDDGIITYNTEEWGYVAVRALLSNEIQPNRIAMRDQKSYCSILLDNNNRKPICRFYNFAHWEEGMENIGKNANVLILNKGNDKGERFELQSIDDLYPLADKLIEAAMRHENSSKEHV